MDIRDSAAIMGVVIDQGGLGKGGLNFDCKVRRESVDPEDLFLGHIGAMDCYAAGLRKAAAMRTTMNEMKEKRYASWKTTSIGPKILAGTATLEECVVFAKEQGEPAPQSSKQELFEIVRNRFLYS